jgi:hypothetical protein
MRRFGLRIAAWLSVAVGVYAVVAAASLLGLAAGAFAGALGSVVSLAVLTDRPDGGTRRAARIALGLNGLALAIVVAVVVAIGISEL